jgi:S1-C subfamily serine protease
MLDKLKWGAVIMVSVVLGGAVVIGINSLDSDDDEPSTTTAAATATQGADNGSPPSTTPVVETVSHTIPSEVADLYEEVRPSVVRINASAAGLNAGGVGSGIVLDTEGHVLTNYHVVQNFDVIDVVLADGTAGSAVLVGADPGNDLAVLKADIPADQLSPATFGDSDAIRTGEFVIAVGNPFDLEGSVTQGIVSGIGRSLGSGTGRPLRQLIQSDAAINPGNSGGAMFNAAGEVIGITTAIENPSGDRVFVGIGYAVPSNVAMRFLPRMLAGETVEHPQLGVQLATEPITPSVAADLGLGVEHGVLIVAVTRGTGADQAGLRGGVDSAGQPTGDVIIRLDNEEVRNFDDLANYIDSKQVGDTIDVVVVRDGSELTIPVTLNAWQSG